MLQPNEDDRPFWLSAIRTAKAVAFDRLPPEERAAAMASLHEARERAKERKVEARERMQRIVGMLDAGYTGAEIAGALGRAAYRVRTFAAAHGVEVRRSETIVGYRVPVTVQRRATLRMLAAKHGAPNEAAPLELIVAECLAHNGQLEKLILRNPVGWRARVGEILAEASEAI